MKKKIISRFIIVFAAILLCFGGCEEDSSAEPEISGGGDVIEGKVMEVNKDTVILTVGDNKTAYNEMLLYIRSYMQKIESLYGSDIWNYELDENGTTYSEMLKDKILEEIKYIKIVCAQAEGMDIALAEDEKLDVKEYTADYMLNFTEEELEYYGFSEETVRKLYEENLLANKIYERLTLNVDTDVDDDEVRHAVFLYIFISKSTFNEEGVKTEYTEEELEAIRLLAGEIHERAETEDFYTLAKEYTENEDEIEITCSREDMKLELAEEAFLLKEGEVSGIIEDDTGYFIFYCKSEKDEAATEEAKIKIIVERQNTAFFDSFSKWEKDTKVTLNEKIWDMIDFSDLKPDMEIIQ